MREKSCFFEFILILTVLKFKVRKMYGSGILVVLDIMDTLMNSCLEYQCHNAFMLSGN